MPLSVEERIERLTEIRGALERGEICSKSKRDLGWICEAMMEVIESLVEEAPNFRMEMKLVRLYSEYHELGQVFARLPN